MLTLASVTCFTTLSLDIKAIWAGRLPKIFVKYKILKYCSSVTAVILVRMKGVEADEGARKRRLCSSMVSIWPILSKKPLRKLFGGAGCWIWCWQLQQIYCILNLWQLQQDKEVCQYSKLPIFFHSQKVFQH